jgi:tellurite resistance protein TerC
MDLIQVSNLPASIDAGSIFSATSHAIAPHLPATLAIADATTILNAVKSLPATVVDQVHGLISQLSPESLSALAHHVIVNLQSFGMDDFMTGAPIIASLILLEGLLSVDNAMVLAAMVQHLPDKQQQLALRAGIFGAYAGRITMLATAAWILGNPWIKLAGGGFLVYLMVSNLGLAEPGEDEEDVRAIKGGFWATVLAVEIADLSFSVDNVAAAVAMSDKMWAVIAGVCIGILAMRFVAGIFVGLIKKYPVLEKIAYLLVGWIGILLILEEQGIFETNELTKFVSILSIIAAGFAYEQIPAVKKVLRPSVIWTGELFGNIYELTTDVLAPVGAILRPVKAYVGTVAGDVWETTAHLAKPAIWLASPAIWLASRTYALGAYARKRCFTGTASSESADTTIDTTAAEVEDDSDGSADQ